MITYEGVGTEVPRPVGKPDRNTGGVETSGKLVSGRAQRSSWGPYSNELAYVGSELKVTWLVSVRELG